MTNPAIAILLTTYRRPECALKTIQALKENLIYDQVWWMISDDGSPKEDIQKYVSEIGPSYRIELFNSEHRGVGYGMNHSLRKIFSISDYCLVMEDDWVLQRPLEMAPYVRTLDTMPAGMVRFGYLSPNLLGYLVTSEGKLFWRLEDNSETYRFTGHPSLRHRRFHETYGWYDEGLPSGMTELSMCGRVNQRPDGPAILYPAECGAWGFFGHIGAESLADIPPSA